MRTKGWDKLLKSCTDLDKRREKTVTIEAFKQALRNVDRTLSDEQVRVLTSIAKVLLCQNR